jgi:hypothetical protein
MIGSKTKRKLLHELEKSGNVLLSCLKIGIDKSTFYRWREQDAEFRKMSDRVIRIGRENNCDISEHSLMLNVKEKKMDAIKYVLSHNSPRYKPKKSNYVLIEHKNMAKMITPQPSFSQMLWDEARKRRVNADTIKEQYKGREFPLKPDGTPIQDKELYAYEQYINDWFKQKEKEEKENGNEEIRPIAPVS